MSAIFGETLTFGQEKGPDVKLIVFGDELYARYEDLNGYTVVYDPELGLFCYARLAAGVFRSTGVPVGEPPPADLARHLQELPEAIRAKSVRAGATPRRHGETGRTGGDRAHLRPEPGAAGGAGPVDRRRQGADHPRQLPGRDEHRDAR